MTIDLSTRAIDARELMDDSAADERMLARTYDLFRFVNAVVSSPGALYRRDIRPRAREGLVRILDVGAGGGDFCRMVAARLRRDGLSGEITALDADERAVRWAREHDDGSGVRYRTAFAGDLADAGEQFDVVFSNHVLHHLSEPELRGVLHDSTRLIDRGGVVVHRDIARSRAAYSLYAAATWPIQGTLLRGSFIREDGLISIRRSYTAAELDAVAPPGWTVKGSLPARLELRWGDRDPSDA